MEVIKIYGSFIRAMTYVVEKKIIDTLNSSAKHFIIGLGDSAANNFGILMLKLLGRNSLDCNNE